MQKKSLAIVFLIIICSLLVTSWSPKDKDSDNFVVGLECNYAPFNWTQTDDANGAVAINGGGGYCGGYDVEFAKVLAEALGRKLVISKIEWDGLIPAVNSGKIDAVIAGMSPTEERKTSVDFSAPYYESDLVLVIRKDGKFTEAKTIQDFSGAKVTAQLNTFHYTVIDQIKGVVKRTAMPDFPAMIVALNSGKIDAYVSERPGAVSAIESNPTLTFVEFSAENGFQASPEDVAIAVAMKKGNEDIPAINKAIEAVSKEKRQEMMDAAIAVQPVSQ